MKLQIEKDAVIYYLLKTKKRKMKATGLMLDMKEIVKWRTPEKTGHVQDSATPVEAQKNGSIQKAMEWGAELGAEIAQAVKDKKVTWSEKVGFVDNGIQVIPIITNYKSIPADWEYLKEDVTYLEAILKGMETKLGTTSEHARAVVLQSVVVGVEIGKLIDKVDKALDANKQ